MKFKNLLILPLLVASLQAASVSDLTFTLINGDTEYSVSDCLTSASGSLDIPSSYNGLPVTQIGDSAFSYCSSLTSINIPDSVTSIRSYAFSYCSSLTSINIPDSVTSIGSHAFSNCRSIASITIPDGVTSIAGHVFFRCYSLTSITIPDSVTSIGTNAFHGCVGFTSIIIPSSVTLIDDTAFRWCSHLASVTIPDSVTSIGYGAFSYCTRLASVTFEGSAPTIGTNVFKDIQASDILVKEAYAASYGGEGATYGGLLVTPLSLSLYNSLVAERDAALAAKTTVEAERDVALVERDAALAERDAALVERDARPTIDQYNAHGSSERTAGRNDVTSNPGSYDLYTQSEYYSHGSSERSAGHTEGRTEGRSDVTSSPSSYNLYTESDYNSYGISERSAGRTVGRSDVTSSPSSYNLYTESQYNSLVAERDARYTQSEYDAYGSSERSAGHTEGRTEGRSDVTSSPNTYDLFTESQYNSLVAERDARYTQSEYDAYGRSERSAGRTVGRSDVTSNPSMYSLYTKSEYDANGIQMANAYREVGRADVTDYPNSYSLFTEDQYNSYGSSERSAGRADVTSSPSSYSLFTEDQYNSYGSSERSAGRADVTSSPSSYSLFTESQYNSVVAERDARLTQAESEATVAGFEAEIARLETEVDNAEMGRIVVGKLGIVEPDWAEGGFRSPTPSTNEYHGELYGQAVATNNDGSVLVITEGIVSHPDDTLDAYVFNVSPASGGLLQKGSAVPILEAQKVCISDDGNTLVVTDRFHSSNTGKVDVYSYTYGDWVLQSSLTGTSANDHFGYSVAINESGDRIAVGATQNDPLWQIPYWWKTSEVGYQEPGYVSIYDYDGSNWIKVADIVGSAFKDKFGTSLDFNSAGDVLVVGAHRNDGQAGTSGQTGQVKIFTLNSVNSGWTQLGNTLYGSAPDQHFGFSVAIDGIGNTLAVGAPGANGDVEECGLVTIFEYDQNTDSWSVHGDPIHGDASHDLSGEAVDLSDDGLRLAIGAARHDGPFGVDSGQIRVFDYVNGSWTKNGSDIDGETDTHRVGGTIALSGDGTRLFSAERRWSVDNNSVSGPSVGRVRLFQDTLLYGGQSDYDSLLAERDALPTQAAYDAVVAERDALPTQAAYDAVVAERDALPTQAAYDAVVAERDSKFTLDEIKDLRPSTTMIEVQNGEATIQLDMHQSNDLQAWSKIGESISMTVPANADTKFFRHAFSSSDATVETSLEFTFIGTNNHDFSAYYGNEAIISTSDIPLYETGSDNYYLSTYQVIEWSSNTPIGGSQYGRPKVTVAKTSSLVGHNLKIRFFKYDSDNANNFSSTGTVLTIDGDALAQQDQTVVSASGAGVASQLGYSVRVWKEAKP